MVLDPGGQRSKDIVIMDEQKAEPGTLWLPRPDQISGLVREELSLLDLLGWDHPAQIRVFPLSHCWHGTIVGDLKCFRKCLEHVNILGVILPDPEIN